METIWRFLSVLRAALLAGLTMIVRVLMDYMEREHRSLSSSISALPAQQHPYRSLSTACEMSLLSNTVNTWHSEPKSLPQIEYLHGNQDSQDTAMFRLPTNELQRSILLKLSAAEYQLLRRVRQQEGAITEEQAVVRALSLFEQIAPKMKSGYLLRLERQGPGPKKAFIFE